jgi:hypothetical protein
LVVSREDREERKDSGEGRDGVGREVGTRGDGDEVWGTLSSFTAVGLDACIVFCFLLRKRSFSLDFTSMIFFQCRKQDISWTCIVNLREAFNGESESSRNGTLFYHRAHRGHRGRRRKRLFQFANWAKGLMCDSLSRCLEDIRRYVWRVSGQRKPTRMLARSCCCHANARCDAMTPHLLWLAPCKPLAILVVLFME